MPHNQKISLPTWLWSYFSLILYTAETGYKTPFLLLRFSLFSYVTFYYFWIIFICKTIQLIWLLGLLWKLSKNHFVLRCDFLIAGTYPWGKIQLPLCPAAGELPAAPQYCLVDRLTGKLGGKDDEDGRGRRREPNRSISLFLHDPWRRVNPDFWHLRKCGLDLAFGVRGWWKHSSNLCADK